MWSKSICVDCVRKWMIRSTASSSIRSGASGMSSSKEPDVAGGKGSVPHRALSIALRMALWYALSAFTLIAVATGALYSVLIITMYQEDLRDLADNLNNARLLLRSSAPGQFERSAQDRPSWAPSHQPEIYLRVLDSCARTLT